jgi:hypothetical protein
MAKCYVLWTFNILGRERVHTPSPPTRMALYRTYYLVTRSIQTLLVARLRICILWSGVHILVTSLFQMGNCLEQSSKSRSSPILIKSSYIFDPNQASPVTKYRYENFSMHIFSGARWHVCNVESRPTCIQTNRHTWNKGNLLCTLTSLAQAPRLLGLICDEWTNVTYAKFCFQIQCWFCHQDPMLGMGVKVRKS